jgi:hypothetical protein
VGLRLLPQRGLFSAIGELFGTQDIEVGHALFDSTFKVKGQPEAKVAELLSGTVADRILTCIRWPASSTWATRGCAPSRRA